MKKFEIFARIRFVLKYENVHEHPKFILATSEAHNFQLVFAEICKHSHII